MIYEWHPSIGVKTHENVRKDHVNTAYRGNLVT